MSTPLLHHDATSPIKSLPIPWNHHWKSNKPKNLKKSRPDLLKLGSLWQGSNLELPLQSSPPPSKGFPTWSSKAQISLTRLRSQTTFEIWNFLRDMRPPAIYLRYHQNLEKLRTSEKSRPQSQKNTDVSRRTQAWNHVWDIKPPLGSETIRISSSHLETVITGYKSCNNLKGVRSDLEKTRISLKRRRSKPIFEDWNLIWDVKPPLKILRELILSPGFKKSKNP